jgi:hypothetical protein
VADRDATAVVLPEDLAAKGRLERLLGDATDPVATLRARCGARVVVVPRSTDG